MTRPGWLPLWIGTAVGLGSWSGGMEVAFRAAPRLGMDWITLMCWWSIAVAINVVLAVVVAAVAARWWERPVGVVAAALLAVHGGMVWRFDFAVNRFLRDPVVWGGALVVLGISAGLGWWIQRTEWTRRWLGKVGLVAALASSVLAVWMNTERDTSRTAVTGPNVVVFTLDTTRADRLGAYGADNETPHIDTLARQGVVFETAVSPAPLTESAHLALFTGRPPHVTGVVSNGTHIEDRPALLYRQLREAGYATAGFVAAFPLHARFGWAQGMDVYDDDFGTVPGMHRLNLVKAFDQIVLRQHVLRERRGDRVVTRALEWLDRDPGAPFFLWVHLFDPHGPYEAPEHPFDPPVSGESLDLPAYWPAEHRAIVDADWLIDAYAAEVRYADTQVGRVIEALRSKGILDNTIVVLTADHGESLTENGLLFDHGDDLFEPSLRVPLIVRYPPVARPGLRVQCLASNMDVAPTVLGLLQRPNPHSGHGVDRTGELGGEMCRDNPLVATTVSGRFVDPPPIDHALRWPGTKAIRTANGETSCYDVGHEVADEHEITPCSSGIQVALDQALSTGTAPVAPRLDDVTTEALRALGYVE